MKITDYELVSALDADDVFIIDGARGTKIINQSNLLKEAKVYEKTISSISSLPITVSDSNITSDMVVVNSTFSNPAAPIGSEWTVNTANGSMTISGSINGTTNLTLLLEKKR